MQTRTAAPRLVLLVGKRALRPGKPGGGDKPLPKGQRLGPFWSANERSARLARAAATSLSRKIGRTPPAANRLLEDRPMTPSWWRWLSRGLLELLSPGCCHLCGRHIPQVEQVFCEACRHDLLTDPFPLRCPHCAAPIGPYVPTTGGCFSCRKENFPFQQALCLGPYKKKEPSDPEPRLSQLVRSLKRPSSEFLAGLIVRLWLERDRSRFETLGVDAVVPVPSHWLRRLWRGYDPASTLARELAGQLRLPCERRWLYRARHTPQQTRQRSAADRRGNVLNAFAVRKGVSLKGRALLLIDDVMTTGSTLREAARPLVRAGAARVVVAMLGRAQGTS